jgi:P27 family predicted phage terminase small subunit
MGSRGPLSKKSAATQGKNLVTRVPPPPPRLGACGKAEWKRVAAELGPKGRNVLTEASLGLLEDLARAADDAEAFRAMWKKEGMTVAGQGREFAHPMIIAEREARSVIHRIRRELGVTPASVVRVPAGPGPEEDESGFEDIE